MFYQQNKKLSEILNYNLSERTNAQIEKGLKEYNLLLNALQHALRHFSEQNYEKFDSLVGENACQIRAVKITFLASDNTIDVDLLSQRASALQMKIEELLSPSSIGPILRSKTTLEEVFQRGDLELSLTSDEMFLFQAFLLSEMKSEPSNSNVLSSLTVKSKTCPGNLKNYGDVSSNFTSDTMRKLRRLLSQSSVDFVKELAWDLGDPSLIEMVSDKYLYVHNNAWPCLPMYWTYKILLKASMKKGIPIVLKARFLSASDEGFEVIEEEDLYFSSVQGEHDFSYINTTPDENDYNQPACIFAGVLTIDKATFCKMKWQDDFLNQSLSDAILSGAADHRQYPDPSIDVEVNDPSFDRHLEMASKKGFSLENPSLFFINHVYPMLVKRAINEEEQDQEILISF